MRSRKFHKLHTGLLGLTSQPKSGRHSVKPVKLGECVKASLGVVVNQLVTIR